MLGLGKEFIRIRIMVQYFHSMNKSKHQDFIAGLQDSNSIAWPLSKMGSTLCGIVREPAAPAMVGLGYPSPSPGEEEGGRRRSPPRQEMELAGLKTLLKPCTRRKNGTRNCILHLGPLKLLSASGNFPAAAMGEVLGRCWYGIIRIV